MQFSNEPVTEGAVEDIDVLKIDLTDDEIASRISNRISKSQSYWNEKINLDKVQEENEKYYLGTYFDKKSLYPHQVPYQNNRIFADIETLIPMATANPAQPIVIAGQDNEASYELAQNLGNILLDHYEEHYLKKKAQIAARHILAGYRIASYKYRWNDRMGPLYKNDNGSYEPMGDVEEMVVRPQRLVLDQMSTDPDNVPLIGELLDSTVEEIGLRFSAKKDQFLQSMGIQRGVATQLSKRVGYWEVWFTYYGANGPKEGVAWKYNDTVLGAIKNPNWNYDEIVTNDKGEAMPANFFSHPQKPYCLMNTLNLGKYIYDDTSLIEQARVLQDILDKRGRQIVENADQANSGLLLNSDMISEEAAAKLIGDPMEKLMVKGDVRMGAARLPPPLLEPYVLNDKLDARSEIDNLFGTHAPTRGAASGANTLGQEVLSQRQDISRTQILTTALEDGADRLYKGIVQMMKVFYDKPRVIKIASEEGKSQFITFSNKCIEPGVNVRVKSGSLLPDDPVAKAQETLKALPILDPLSIAEGLGKKNPKQFAKRLLYFRLSPDKYISEFLQDDLSGDGSDPSAIQEQQLMASGQEAPPQVNPTKAHLATHQEFVSSPDFKNLDPQIQAGILAHIKQEINNTKQNLGQSVAQPPGGEVPPGDEQQPPTGNMPEQGQPTGQPNNEEGIMQRIMNRVKGFMGGGEQQ